MYNNPFIIEAKEDTPLVILEKKVGANRISLKGISMPENLFEFYTPLFETVFDFFASEEINELEVNLEYMNSMSNKQILKLICAIHEKSPKVKVLWKYAEQDDLIKLKGEEIKSVYPNINISLIEY